MPSENPPPHMHWAPIPDPKRILVFTKYRFIGDTLLAIPTLRAASRRWPLARITLVTGARACELLQNCPYVHEFVEFDPYRTQDRGLRRYFGLVHRLQQTSYDLALVLNRSFHGALTAALARAKVRVGWAGFQSRDFLLNRRCLYDPDDPEILSYLDVLRLAAQDIDGNTELNLWVTERERREIPEALLKSGEWIGVQPGASHGYKQWPADRYAVVIDRLVQQDPRHRIVFLGGEEEKAAAASVVAHCAPMTREKIANYVGKLPLRQTLGIMTNLRLFLGNDTAIRHAAVALDIPSIGIFGPTSSRKWGNAAPPRHQVIVSRDSTMDGVATEDVLIVLEQQLANSSAGTLAR